MYDTYEGLIIHPLPKKNMNTWIPDSLGMVIVNYMQICPRLSNLMKIYQHTNLIRLFRLQR